MLPTSTVVLFSVLTLCSTLTGVVGATGPRPVCTAKHYASQGETCTSIGQQVGAGQPGIQSMNSGINCNGLTAGTEVCTKQRTPTCLLTKPAPSTKCDGLAAESNISVAEFVQYNGDVDDNCDNLVVGNPYCVSID